MVPKCCTTGLWAQEGMSIRRSDTLRKNADPTGHPSSLGSQTQLGTGENEAAKVWSLEETGQVC